MPMTRYLPLLFLGILLESTCTQHQTPYRRPFGPLMCLRLCQQISGCTHVSFVISDFACYMTDARDAKRTRDIHLITVTNTKKGLAGKTSAMISCSLKSMIILTRTKGVQCVRVLTRKDKKVSMLVFNPDDQSVSALDITSKSLQKIFHKYVYNSMVYDQISKRLIYNTKLPPGIVSRTLDGKNVIVITKIHPTKSFAIDEKRHLLFLVANDRFVYRLDINRKTVVNMTTVRYIRHLTLDPYRETIYVHTRSHVFRGSYYTSKLETVVTGEDIKDISLDYVNNVLYIADDRNIKKMLLLQNFTTILMTFETSPTRLFFHRTNIYCITKSERGTKLGVLNGDSYQLLKSFWCGFGNVCQICGMA